VNKVTRRKQRQNKRFGRKHVVVCRDDHEDSRMEICSDDVHVSVPCTVNTMHEFRIHMGDATHRIPKQQTVSACWSGASDSESDYHGKDVDSTSTSDEMAIIRRRMFQNFPKKLLPLPWGLVLSLMANLCPPLC
jgi:hypothetical protein